MIPEQRAAYVRQKQLVQRVTGYGDDEHEDRPDMYQSSDGWQDCWYYELGQDFTKCQAIEAANEMARRPCAQSTDSQPYFWEIEAVNVMRRGTCYLVCFARPSRVPLLWERPLFGSSVITRSRASEQPQVQPQSEEEENEEEVQAEVQSTLDAEESIAILEAGCGRLVPRMTASSWQRCEYRELRSGEQVDARLRAELRAELHAEARQEGVDIATRYVESLPPPGIATSRAGLLVYKRARRDVQAQAFTLPHYIPVLRSTCAAPTELAEQEVVAQEPHLTEQVMPLRRKQRIIRTSEELHTQEQAAAANESAATAQELPEDFQRRIGAFSISEDLLKARPASILRVLSECIVLRCEHCYATQKFNYTAMCRHFEPLPDGAIPLRYSPVITREARNERDGRAEHEVRVTWQRQ